MRWGWIPRTVFARERRALTLTLLTAQYRVTSYPLRVSPVIPFLPYFHVTSVSILEIILQSIILFSNLGIPSAYLFGSYAKGTQTERSDIDFVIDFRDTKLTLSDLSKIGR
jgi:hypothetical protein